MIRRPPRSTRTDTLCPYTTLFRSEWGSVEAFSGPEGDPPIAVRFAAEARRARQPRSRRRNARGRLPHRSAEALVQPRAERSTPDACPRSEEHTSELQSLMRISYAVFCLKKKKHRQTCVR